MYRFRWSIRSLFLLVALVCSFEAVSAKDKDRDRDRDSKQPQSSGGGQSPRTVAPAQQVGANPSPMPKQNKPARPNDSKNPQGTAPPQFQPNKPDNNLPGGNQTGGRGVPTNPNNGSGRRQTKINPPEGRGQPENFNTPKAGTNLPGVGLPNGSPVGRGKKMETGRPLDGIDRGTTNVGKPATPSSGKNVNSDQTTGIPTETPNAQGLRSRRSTGKPKISIEPDGQKQILGGKSDGLPPDRKGTDKLNPQLGIPGPLDAGFQDSSKHARHEKTRPMTISKNGRLPVNPTESSPDSLGAQVGQPADRDQPKGVASDKKLDRLLQVKKHDDLSRELKKINESPELAADPELKHLNLNKISGVHQERLARTDSFQHWHRSKVGQKLRLEQQFEFQKRGDLARRMNLSNNLMSTGGWTRHRQHGLLAAGFTTGAFSMWYSGGGCYPAHAWCPIWSPWVDWSYWNTCPILYDPRPYYCIPLIYDPCPLWVYYDYPVWSPLSMVTCGTWIDVAPVVMTAGQDLQLLAVRFVDNGHSEQNLGPRYRVWVRNNSPTQIVTPFSVLLLASNEQVPTVDAPQMGVVLPSMDIGETQVLDIRLPIAASRLGTTSTGLRVPFTYLHVLVDSHQQIPETFEDNNGAVLLRTDVLPVDPAAFSTDVTAASPESLLTIAGEGFGPEPGQVIVSFYGQEVQAEIHGWYDLGIRFAVPNFDLTQAVDAEVLVVRGDSAVSNPLTLRLVPDELIDETAAFPDAPLPIPPE